MRILGIDPGTRVMGFGLLACRQPQLSLRARDYRLLDAGVLELSARLPLNQRLALLHEGLYDLLAQLRPELCVMETAFIGINAQAALKLGQARGALLVALSRRGVPLAELTPREAKKIVSGRGSDSKEQVAAALGERLGLGRLELPLDATDAIALALAHGLSAGAAPAVALRSAPAPAAARP